MRSAVSVLLQSAATALLLAAASSAIAAPPSTSQPLILDTQGGIHDGKSGGTGLQTAPPSRRGAAGGQPYMAPEASQPNGAAQYPIIVAPYIEVPGGGPNPPYPTPRPRPTPH
ncbi:MULTISPECIES: hypothetical protein [Cupriavidus]|nr:MULTISPECIES: hypothetical protein [Cupriavidus]TPQ44136.1 hypothetical protein C2U69_00910 [Cupriavidus pinatubonensis]